MSKFSARVTSAAMGSVFRDADVDLSCLAGKQIAVLGYGSQGRAQALNLRDSGFEPVIGVRMGASFDKAVADGFRTAPIATVADFDVLVLCLPDIEAGEVFKSEILPALQPNATLIFAHGFAVHYNLVDPPEGVQVILVAPMGAGPVMRARYEHGSGVPALLAVHFKSSPDSIEVAKAYGSAIGCGRIAMLESSFEEETVSDLFGEQAVLCGGLPELMRTTFHRMVEGGIQPEVAYIAAVHEVKLIVDLIYEKGLDGMVKNISKTAEWGAYQAGPLLFGRDEKRKVSQVYDDVQSGRFSREWMGEVAEGSSRLKRKREEFLADPIHEVGARVRKLMGIQD